jgi:hypothetical protein
MCANKTRGRNNGHLGFEYAKGNLFITLQQLKLKVIDITQIRRMPFHNGILRGSW